MTTLFRKNIYNYSFCVLKLLKNKLIYNLDELEIKNTSIKYNHAI